MKTPSDLKLEAKSLADLKVKVYADGADKASMLALTRILSSKALQPIPP